MALARNNAQVLSIASPAGAVGDDCTWISYWDAATGGTYFLREDISTNPDALSLGDRLEIAANALTLNQPASANETEAFARKALQGRIAGGLWIQFHTGDPGSSGNSNVITELGRVQIAQSGWTIT